MGGEKDASRGGFFQLFDWTAKSRKKLFSSKSDLPERSKQGKKSHGNLPMTRLHLVDEDDVGAESSIKGGCDYSCASSVTDEEGYGSKAPGVVARLMGLDSLPASNFSDPYSTPFFDTQSLKDVHYHGRNLDYLCDQIAHSGNLLNKVESLDRNSVEPKPQKIISKPIEKFQTEVLPPKSAKSIPVTQYKLLSPIKSHGYIPTNNAAHIMEAAARIIEPRPHAPVKRKMSLVGSSSAPIKVRDLKEKVEATQRMHVFGGSTSGPLKVQELKERVEATHKPSKPAEAPRRIVESSTAKYLKGQSLNKSWNGSAETMPVKPSLDSEEAFSSSRNKGKSISLAIQAKVNVQKREGLHTSGNRSFGGHKDDREVKSSQPFKSQPSVQKNLHKNLFSASLLSLILLLLSSIKAFSSPKIFPSSIQHGVHYPPAFAYYIFGGRGQREQIFRLLLAVYHPRNRYLLHLASEAPGEDRRRLIAAVKAVPAIRAFGNVDVVGKPNYLTYMGSTNLAATLRAAAILLRMDRGWNWFVTLSASDYPLITQDDLSHVFSSVSRDLNFIEHTSDLGWKEDHRIQPVVVDPSTYLARRSQIFQATQRRPTPNAFKVFTGTPWVILSRSFLEFCILGWDNLPRTLLMYFTNVVLPEEGYFHTVLCNAPEFKNTTMNSDLRYMVWDNPPKMEPQFLNSSNYDQMVQSGAVFARQFHKNDPVLDMVDEKILKRGPNRVATGAWCSGRNNWWIDPCSQWGDVNVLKPGPQAKILEESVTNLLDDAESSQCK